MATVAEKEGLTPTMGQSPFAIARGQTFEDSLLREDAEVLREALEKAELLPSGSAGFLDLRLRMNRGPIKDLDEARKRTRSLLEACAHADTKERANLPAIVAAAALRIPGMPVMLPDAVVAIDVLLVDAPSDGKLPVTLTIGEVKTYPDRAGYTSSSDLATARAQAGVYHHALELVLEELRIGDRVQVSGYGFLVLTRSGTNTPSIRAGESLEFQSQRARRGFERLRQAAQALIPFDETDEAAGLASVQGAATHYMPECLSFCDRAVGCRKQAEAVGDGAVLGDEVKQLLGATPLPRAVELLGGSKPRTDREVDFVRMAQEALGGSST